MTDALRLAMSQFVHKECWSVIAGHGTGSTIHLDFGKRVPRLSPVPNERLSPTQRANEGEFDIFVESAWRLEHAGEVICGSTDDDDNDGAMATGLQRLVGKHVVSVEVSAPVPDFVMLFEGELCLKVFCDQTNLRTADDNYSVRWGSTILVVGVRGRVVEEIRNSD